MIKKVTTSWTFALGCLGLAFYLNHRDNRRREAFHKAMDDRIKDGRRMNKELEALESHLADKVETGKFWLQVTDPKNQ